MIADKMNVQWVNAQQLTVAGGDLAALVKKMQIQITKMQTTIDALSAKIGSTKPSNPSSKIKIIAGKLTEGLNMQALPKTWDFDTGAKGKGSTVRKRVVVFAREPVNFGGHAGSGGM